MADRLVLALEGSTGTCSAALLRMRRGTDEDGSRWGLAARRVKAGGGGQTRVLLCLVDEMLEETGLRPRDLGAVVVGTGPGTFTGVRITVATARALSLALAVPVLGVSTLGALAAGAAAGAAGGAAPGRGVGIQGGGGLLLVPVVDAHRGQLFYGLYRPAGAEVALGTARWVRTSEFGVCDRDALGGLVTAAANDLLGPDRGHDTGACGEIALVVGQGASLAGDLPSGVMFKGADLGAEWLVIGQDRLDEPGPAPQGARVAPWLAKALVSKSGAATLDPVPGVLGSPEAVTPIYVRAPDADIHITKMRDPWADGYGDG